LKVNQVPSRKFKGLEPGIATVALVTALSLIATSCKARPTTGDAELIEPPQVPSSARESTTSALRNPLDPALPPPTIDIHELIAGGPPPDGIPPIDRPKFELASAVAWIDDREPVIAVEIEGEARAYPIQILIWHEIVNDTIAGEPIVVSYCPLCNSAIVFSRRLGGRVLDFGTSGKLYKSDLVMYDRQTESLWPQFMGEAVAGVLTGSKLDVHLASTVTWREWRKANSDGLVLSRQTGYSRPYGTNPYVGYDNSQSRPFFYEGDIDTRLPAKARVVGITRGSAAVAVVTEWLAERRVAELTLGSESITVWYLPGMASALDTRDIASGRVVGASAVFVPVIDERRLTFRPGSQGDTFFDNETGSEWNWSGEAIAGALVGHKLQAVEHVDTFWFAWSGFVPDTAVVGAEAS
jgi:hypothetical protein